MNKSKDSKGLKEKMAAIKKSYLFSMVLLVCIFMISICSNNVFAATFSYGTSAIVNGYSSGDGGTTSTIEITVVGHNQTKGITLNLPSCTTGFYTGPNGWSCYKIQYTVPDDGCTWQIYGSINVTYWYNGIPSYNHKGEFFQATHTTSGSFTGPSLANVSVDTNAIANAVAGNSTIRGISTNAQTAANNSSYSGYSSAYWAYYAYYNAYYANNNASTAVSNAASAASNASTAASNAQAAVNILNGTSNGGKSLAATYDKAAVAGSSGPSASDIATAVANTQRIKDINTNTLNTLDYVKAKAIKVVSGVPFTEISYTKDVVAGKTKDNAVEATDVGDGYTKLKGTITGQGEKKADIYNGATLVRSFMFNIIPAPAGLDIATVTFQ